MMGAGLRLATATAITALTLLGCGKPEDTSMGPPIPVATATMPAYPAWSTPMIGKLVSQVAKGRGPCVGVFDVVSTRYAKPRPGVKAEGWGWDVAAKQPLKQILFVDSKDRIVGAADGGKPRPDVSEARADVKSPNTGWKGVAGVDKGQIAAMGVTEKDAACDLGAKDVGADAY